jgi:hypothetical protein
MSGKEDYDIDMSKPTADANVAIAEAVPQPNPNEPPIPAGHARFYCSKCHTVRNVEACDVAFAILLWFLEIDLPVVTMD